MPKPTKTAEWATAGGADIVEPALGQKQDGWDVSDKPPAGWWNWWMNLVHLWLVWLDTKFVEGASGDRIGCHGIDSTGVGAGQSGVSGTGGTAGGAGVVGQGDGIAPGVIGTGDAASIGPGVRGTSVAAVGLEAIGDTTNPPVDGSLHLTPQAAAPTTGRVGTLYVTTAGVLYICTNSVGPVWTKVGAQ